MAKPWYSPKNNSGINIVSNALDVHFITICDLENNNPVTFMKNICVGISKVESYYRF